MGGHGRAMGSDIASMAILNFLLIATGTISQICAALPSTWQLPTAASPAPPLLWKFKTGQSIENAVAVGNGIVYAGSDDDSVYALNATTGEKIWQDDEYSTTRQSMMIRAPLRRRSRITLCTWGRDHIFLHCMPRLESCSGSSRLAPTSFKTPSPPRQLLQKGLCTLLPTKHALLSPLEVSLRMMHAFMQLMQKVERCSGSIRHLTECPVQQFQMESCTLGHGISSCMHWMPRPEHCSGSMKLAVTLPPQLLRMEWFTLDLGMATYTQLMPRLEQSVGPLLSPRVIVYAQGLRLIRGLCILVPPTTIFMR